MYLRKIEGPRVVTLPDGRSLSRSDLPATNGLRWTLQRKRIVAHAVQSGLIPRLDAREAYELSDAELDAWCCKFPLRNGSDSPLCE